MQDMAKSEKRFGFFAVALLGACMPYWKRNDYKLEVLFHVLEEIS